MTLHEVTLHTAGPSLWARRLAWGGLVPFVGLAAALAFVPAVEQGWVGTALLGYGATIVSFLGAIHWGLAMREGVDPPLPSLLWGVVPSLLAWAALLLGSAPGLLLMVALLWACLGADRVLYPRSRLQAWLPMRWRLTWVSSVACLAGAVALLGAGHRG